ncbi:AAA ATPase [Nitratidesulfovibrio vulgaris DP4]|uniref:AAA ATPase n=3 Tax=Nitratidesulfovibrio vulgaris TaxID=881 RepID=A0A0H3AAJ0_NITV4|nr:AAA ATPase [Nitratidesulfovibrio vulgaris DP4]
MLDAGGRQQVLMDLGIDVASSRVSKTDKREESLISLASSSLNRSPLQATLVVGELLGLKPEYCFRTFPVGANARPPLSPRISSVAKNIPKQLFVKDSPYTLADVDYIHDFAGAIEQAVCCYRHGSKEFFLVAGRTLRIGATPASAWLYSRTRMADDREAPVLLCLDMRVAMHFRKMAREAKVFERVGVIVSGCFGGAAAFDALHYKDLAGHPVVIVPGSTREELKGAEEWAKRCAKEGAESVGVYPWPIIVPGMPVLDDSCPHGPWQKELWGRAVYLDRIELPSKLAREVLRKAIPVGEYRAWMRSMELVPEPAEEVRTNESTLELIRLDDIRGREHGSQLELSWDGVITPQYTTLIWGCSNAGKSWVAIQLALAMAGGFNAFGLPAMAPRHVCYLDGEVGKEDFKARCDQLLHDNPDVRELVKQNLHILPQSGLNILDGGCSREVIELLRQAKADVLVIDNLLSLAPSAAKSNADGLFNFVRQVEQAGIAVIIVHHSGKDGTNFKGSGDLASLSQNVIRLDGRDQLASQENRSPELEEVCQADGPVVRMTVTKCKAAPQLERKSCTYHLPVHGGWQHVEGALDDFDQSLKSEACSNESRVVDAPASLEVNMDSLSPDEEKVFHALKEHKSTRAELETRTSLKTDKLLNTLQQLTKRGLIVKEGNGKATYYRCV